MAKIKNIEARKILDSRGKPTVEVKITTDTGFMGIDSVPSGTSTGTHEAMLVEPEAAVANVNQTLAPALLGMEVAEQGAIDKKMIELDGSENKGRLGANAILGVSLAVARTAAMDKKMPLYRHLNKLFEKILGRNAALEIPVPMMVMLCGGKHAQNELGIQEFLVLAELEDGTLIWQTLKKTFEDKNIDVALGLEGAFSPKISQNEQALEILKQTIEGLKDKLHGKIQLGLDIAGNNCKLANEEVLKLFRKFDLFSLEDPFGENDWEKFGQLKLELEETKKPFLLIGDDLFATRKELLQKGITQLVANGIIIKPNQVGTLSEVFEVAKLAHNANYTMIVSHRSGETMDSFIADLAVAIGAKFLKAGAPIPPERILKYHRLEEIRKELQS